MKLIKFDQEKLIPTINIIAVGRGTSDLREFCTRFDVTSQVCLFLSDNIREQRDPEVEGRRIPAGSFSDFQKEYEKCDSPNTLVVIMDDYYREVFDAFEEVVDLPEDYPVYYYLNAENEIEYEYREKYSNHPLEDIIVFRSGPHASQYVHGMDFADNARALFEYMLEGGLNYRYELVWLVKDPAEFSERYAEVPGVHFVSFEWANSGTREQMDEYYRVLCLAKYLFFTDAYGFARNCRADQIRVQLWHGCGFKTRVNFTRCEKRYELMPVISDVYKKIHEDIYGLRDDQVIVTGYPKEDWLFHPEERSFTELFGAPEAEKYIMWLPTFRETDSHLANLNEHFDGGETGLPVLDTRGKLETLNDLLKEKDSVFLVKLHPFQKRSTVHCEGLSNIVLIENEDLDRLDIPINRILGKADALISDYSSAAIDFLILDRPMAFALEDVEEYSVSRGFVFKPIRDFLPGVELFDADDFIRFVSEIAEGIDSSKEKRQKLRGRLHAFSDDKSCQRLLRYLKIE